MKRELKEKDIHERLYKESRSKKANDSLKALLNLRKKQELKKANENRTSRVEEQLYEDAIRRQRSKERNDSKSSIQCPAKFTTGKSEMYAMNKVVKELKQAWEFILKETKSNLINNSSTLNSSNEHTDERVNLISTAYILSMLRYFKKTEDKKEKNLFYDLWTLVRGEDAGGVTFETLKKIVLTIDGFYKGIDTD